MGQGFVRLFGMNWYQLFQLGRLRHGRLKVVMYQVQPIYAVVSIGVQHNLNRAYQVVQMRGIPQPCHL